MQNNKRERGATSATRKLFFNIKKISRLHQFIIIIVLILILIFTWLFASGTINNWINPKKPALVKTNNSEPEPNNIAQTIISGDYNAGQARLDKALSQITNPKDQAWIYIQKASIALNLQKFNEAYDFAKKAEELYPDVNSAQMMASSAAKNGDKADAIAKYKLAISRITGTSGMDDLDRESLQTKIDKLSK